MSLAFRNNKYFVSKFSKCMYSAHNFKFIWIHYHLNAVSWAILKAKISIRLVSTSFKQMHLREFTIKFPIQNDPAQISNDSRENITILICKIGEKNNTSWNKINERTMKIIFFKLNQLRENIQGFRRKSSSVNAAIYVLQTQRSNLIECT